MCVCIHVAIVQDSEVSFAALFRNQNVTLAARVLEVLFSAHLNAGRSARAAEADAELRKELPDTASIVSEEGN